MASAQLGDLAAACAAIDKALLLPDAHPGMWLLAANLFQDTGRFQDALAYAQRVPRDHPGYARARNQMAILLTDLQRLEEAEAACREAVAADPSMVRALCNLAVIRLRQGDASDATRWARKATAQRPDYLQGHVIEAMAALQAGDQVAAAKALDIVLAVNPDHIDGLLLRTTIDRQLHDLEKAIDRIRRVLELSPDRVDAICQLADALFLYGDHDGARAQWERVLNIQPNHVEAALRRVQALPMVYQTVRDIDTARERYAVELRELAAKADTFAAQPAETMRQLTACNFFLAYQGRNDVELQRSYADFVSSLLKRIRPEKFVGRGLNPVSGRRVRIGFASRFFYQSTVGNYFQSWITGLDRDQFEIFVYYTHSQHDGLTDRIRAAVDRFAAYRPTVDAWADQIAEDQLDLLVYPEIGMDAICTTLAAFRLAPIQIAGWGHPVTTGQANIDWYLSCSEMEPADAANHYREALALLPGLGTRYALPKMDERCRQLDRRHYGLPDGETLYLVPQSLFKIHPDGDTLFVSVLAAHPGARLVFFSGQAALVRDLFQARLTSALASAGLSLPDRVLFLPDVPHSDYLRINQLCDVMLDSPHWSGGNTSLDALSVGLPIVTLPGAYMRGRQSMAMLRRLGVDELVTTHAAEYVTRAVALGRDAEYRARISRQIVENHHRLFGDAEPIVALQDFFKRAVASRAELPH